MWRDIAHIAVANTYTRHSETGRQHTETHNHNRAGGSEEVQKSGQKGKCGEQGVHTGWDLEAAWDW